MEYDEQIDRKTAFAPVVDSSSRILLLGTMPGEISLSKQEYYGNKQNQFWKIIFELFNEPFTDIYNERIKFLLSKKIALWDVLSSCEGEGSLDTNIKNEEANNFSEFYNKYPSIQYIFFTSGNAAKFYKKYIGLNCLDLSFYSLPSPSPANARMTFQEKLDKWRVIREILE